MNERMRFIAAVLEQDSEMAELCRQFGISRKTGYKWWKRYREEGPDGLVDRSRAPRRSPTAVADDVVQALLALRRARPTWGPRKLLARLDRTQPRVKWPAPSTVAALLKRHGLAQRRRKRLRTPPWTQPFRDIDRPNAVWSADFKGDFRLGDKSRCFPLTLTDNHSRFLLQCHALPSIHHERVWPIYQRTFQEYGLPDAIRTDNGAPFATKSPTGLSRLAVKLLRLGILPERIRPGHPEENGRHERMHLTLKGEACEPPLQDAKRQQEAFDAFRHDFNHIRPHEALAFDTPAQHYTASTRPFPLALPKPQYSALYDVRKVSSIGLIALDGHVIRIGRPLAGEYVGLREVRDGFWMVRFAELDIGLVNLRTPKGYHPIQPLPRPRAAEAEVLRAAE